MPVKATDTLQEHMDAFLQGEASSQLEGFNPLDHPLYVSLKSDILAGRMTAEEAIDAAVLSFKKDRHEHAA